MATAPGARPTRASVLILLLMVLALAALGPWWRGHRQDALGRELAALAGPGDLQMIASDRCAICVEARQWFERHGVRFSECSIEREPDCASQFRRLGAPGTPVILVRGQPELGFAPERLRQRLGG
jgi:glutaredoxin